MSRNPGGRFVKPPGGRSSKCQYSFFKGFLLTQLPTFFNVWGECRGAGLDLSCICSNSAISEALDNASPQNYLHAFLHEIDKFSCIFCIPLTLRQVQNFRAKDEINSGLHKFIGYNILKSRKL